MISKFAPIRKVKVFNSVLGRSSLSWVRMNSSSSNSSKTLTWQEKVEQLGESFSPPLPLSKSEEDNLTNILQSILAKGIEKDNSNEKVKNHFQGLLNGLQTLTGSDSNDSVTGPNSFIRKSLLPLSERKREDIITSLPISLSTTSSSSSYLLSCFDELYYNEELSRKIALLILKHKSISTVDHVNHMARLIFNGGSGLHKWSQLDKYILRLQIANKYWSIGEKKKPQEMIINDFETVWKPALESTILNGQGVLGYGKALLVFKRRDLMEGMISKWGYDTFNKSSNSEGSKLVMVSDKVNTMITSKSNVIDTPPLSSAPATPPQLNIQSTLLSSLFLPLWKASISCNEYELSEKIIEKALSCCIPPTSSLSTFPIDPALLYTYTLSTLYKNKHLDEPFIRSLIITKVSKIPYPSTPNPPYFYKNTIYNLIDVCSSLSLSSTSSHHTIALQLLPYVEEFTNSTLKQKTIDNRTRTILPARVSLLQLNLSNQQPQIQPEQLPEIITP